MAALMGGAVGDARLAAIDAGALHPPAGAELRVRGFVASPPREGALGVRFVADTGEGRIGVEATAVPDGLVQGSGVSVAGAVREVEEWERALWQRDGASAVLAARRLSATERRRTGVAGALDRIRDRARAALGDGTPQPAAELLRGFVLGEDDRIASDVRDDFRRSGLAHILAVSGQNVMLLAALAMPILALAGVGLRARLVTVLVLVAIYVPVAGGGASIQRAGVMGAAGIVAMLAGRRRSGWYSLGLAAVATLALDPRASADIGWQLSFAAVAGLFALGRPLAATLAPSPERSTPVRRALADGAAITVAATVATAPLVAMHFEVVSLTALPANLAALPAIAPAMWLGMLSGALGQLPGAPVEPLTWLGGLCAGWIAWVAHTLGPEWAQLEVGAPRPLAAAVWTAALAAATRIACAQIARRRGIAPRLLRLAPALAATVLAASLAVGALLARDGTGPAGQAPAPFELRLLDVGQGDAILLRAAGQEPVLVDTGPPGAALSRLESLGVERIGTVFVTHDQLDHSGGLPELVRELDIGRVLVGPGRAPRACRVPLACPGLRRVDAGDSLRAGRLRIDVLWPGGRPLRGADPNAGSLVLAVRFGRFDALLTGDAEAELAPYRAGPVEVLKVAHHGSADAGLPRLLDQAQPRLAVVSVGAANPFGHPDGSTLAELADAGVPVLRTDLAGDVAIEVRGDGWSVG